MRLSEEYELAPDGSEIRPLLKTDGGSLSHCILKPGRVSSAVCHRTVDEIWYFLSGAGEMWRKKGELEDVVQVVSGVCLKILRGTCFQFRNTSEENLCSLIATMPPWPGDQEALSVEGRWPPSP